MQPWLSITAKHSLTADELVQVSAAVGEPLTTPYAGRREVSWSGTGKSYDGVTVSWSAPWVEDEIPLLPPVPAVGDGAGHPFTVNRPGLKTCSASVSAGAGDGFIRCGLVESKHPKAAK